MGYSPWGRKESGTTERLHFHFPAESRANELRLPASEEAKVTLRGCEVRIVLLLTPGCSRRPSGYEWTDSPYAQDFHCIVYSLFWAVLGLHCYEKSFP